ncbi:polysaccharide pyruvyl transferase family protein [Oxalobacteraceae bacterium R-40]|uniref:Polysaccharide pyruvyl transferase family protein n=1 Tax=Keguizhuia sedimenti TaxID=3064264 RepID=A0ABU1BP69_9BURK|nr:polysaccharide pyruvyl transferase family protein [Oxalobacteraceae bacterium R-40]
MNQLNTALFPSSHWGSNIGNAFFHLGSNFLLTSANQNLKIIPSDLPSRKAFKVNESHWKNDCKYSYQVGEHTYLVLDGPMFDLSFRELFEPFFAQAKKNKTRVILLSTGGIQYTDEEIEHCRAVLKEYPPYILTTRDRDTYNNYHDLCSNSYDGICSAWFVPEAYPGYDTPDFNKFITLCFDAISEPEIDLSYFIDPPEPLGDVKVSRVSHSRLEKVLRLLQRKFEEQKEGYKVVRPNHQVLQRGNWRLFFKPGTFVSQTPYTYLNLYRNTSLSVTDRLHACVATLAYGKPARLVINSKRVKLLERVGALAATERVIRIDGEALAREKSAYLDWLSQALAD